MGTFLGDSSFFGPCRDMEGWRKMNLIHRFILKKSVEVNQNPEGEASISRVMLGCSEIACCQYLKLLKGTYILTVSGYISA